MIVNKQSMSREGEQLLMLPGLMCDSSMFRAQFAAFDQAVPAVSYARSDDLRDMAARVLDAAPERFALFGHSMGARVALEIVRRAPDRVTRLALVSTGVHLPNPGEAPKRHALLQLGCEQGIEALIDAWLPPMVAPARQGDAALMASLRTMCIEAGLAQFEAQITALLGRPEVESLLPTIACPVLVAVGAEDIWSPPAQHEAMASQIPNATLVVIPGSGHMLPVEAPDALNQAIAGWLETPILHTTKGEVH